MNRVKACAVLFLDSPAREKIERFANEKGITVENAAIAYTLGALKAMKRRGTASSYAEALDTMEAEQVGDRGNKLTRTVSADNTARIIQKINKINAGSKEEPAYLRSIDKGKTWTPHYPIAVDKAGVSSRSMGKVLGTLYTEWESREIEADPVVVVYNEAINAEKAQIEQNMRLFFAEYASRLSVTAKARLYELAASKVKANYLLSNAPRYDTDKAIRSLSNVSFKLYESFPHRESITGTEFIELVRSYVNPEPDIG
jgi:hypothetical protein